MEMIKKKWIYFKEQPSPGRKTKIFTIRSLDGNSFLGLVKWYGAWRKYCFFPSEKTVYEWDCLRDIADFCQEQTKEYKKHHSQ
jgi:hypothetical protein